MSDFAGEKTEQPTLKRLDEAYKKGQFARSPEVQTVFVLFSASLALVFTGHEMWRQLVLAFSGTLAHLHDIPLSFDTLPSYALKGALVLGQCVAPVAIATLLGSLLAGGIQSRFRTAPEALAADWERLNPVEGFKRVFSFQSTVATALSLVKLSAIFALTFNTIKSIAGDPIFYTSVEVARIAEFLTTSSFKITFRIGSVLLVLAAVDYAYQAWKIRKDLMMTKEEVKEEMKQSEGNQDVKARQRRRRRSLTKRKMLADVAHADVVLTNPTHLAVALRYDRKSMKAPRIVAKGSRLNALRIREIAQQNQIPVLENKPLARLLFKYGKVGGEIPAQLYAAVAEVLAWVYRINAYRYYREQHA